MSEVPLYGSKPTWPPCIPFLHTGRRNPLLPQSHFCFETSPLSTFVSVSSALSGNPTLNATSPCVTESLVCVSHLSLLCTLSAQIPTPTAWAPTSATCRRSRRSRARPRARPAPRDRTCPERKSLLNLCRRTVNLRRPERARNEGFTGPKCQGTHRLFSTEHIARPSSGVLRWCGAMRTVKGGFCTGAPRS